MTFTTKIIALSAALFAAAPAFAQDGATVPGQDVVPQQTPGVVLPDEALVPVVEATNFAPFIAGPLLGAGLLGGLLGGTTGTTSTTSTTN